MSEAHDITIRRIEFELAEKLDPLDVIEGHPEEGASTVALSLLLPYLEPYLIRSLKQAKEHVTDDGLRADIDKFNGQEGQHYRQHKKFNDIVRPGLDGLAALEEELSSDYRDFTANKSLRWNLAYAEGFEAYTCALAVFNFEHGLLNRFEPSAKDLFAWHLVEEMEHRTVAFDVYAHVCGGYFYRLFVGLYAQFHMNRWVMRVTNYILETQSQRLAEQYGGKRGQRKRLLAIYWLAFRFLLPKVLKTYMPWYTPRNIVLPGSVSEMAAHYTEVARRPAT